MPDDASQNAYWFGRSAEDQNSALADAFEHFGPRLRSMLNMRMDPRLASRVDPSDVLQEAFLDAKIRFELVCVAPA